MTFLMPAMLALAVAACGYLLWVVAGAVLIAWATTHPVRKPGGFDTTPASFGAEYEPVTFPSAAGDVRISGWLIPCASPRGLIVLCHGMLANRMELLPWAESFYKAGFSTLVFDFRALGESEGLLATAGYLETQDFLGALDFISNRSDLTNLPIGVFGFSMGGSVAITGAARDQRVKAVATHGAFATLDRAIMQRCRKHFGLMARPAAWSIRGLAAYWMPVHSREFAPIAEAANIAPRPFLILHGSEDSIILPKDAHDLHAAAGTEGGLHILPDSGHRRIGDAHRDNAFETVVSFFTKYLP